MQPRTRRCSGQGQVSKESASCSGQEHLEEQLVQAPALAMADANHDIYLWTTRLLLAMHEDRLKGTSTPGYDLQGFWKCKSTLAKFTKRSCPTLIQLIPDSATRGPRRRPSMTFVPWTTRLWLAHEARDQNCLCNVQHDNRHLCSCNQEGATGCVHLAGAGATYPTVCLAKLDDLVVSDRR